MLEQMRKGAGTWIAKIFIGLLVLSFAVWGIADIFGGYRFGALATVGDVEISEDEYRQAIERERQLLSQRLGRPLTLDQARAIGLDRQVLDRLIGGAAIDGHVRDLGVGISDEAIAEEIRRNPSFQDASGNFSRTIFEQILRNNGLTEAGYVLLARRDANRQQVTGALINELLVPKVLLSAVNRYQNETRILSYFLLPKSAIGEIADPSEQVISEYYEANKASFRAPQYRKVALLIVTPDTVRDKIKVTDEEIKQTYEADINRYRTPEKRRIQQISFPDKESAEAAKKKIEAGTDFAAVAKERGFSEADIDLGLVAKSGLGDPAVADAAFAAQKDQVVGPIVGRLGIFLVRVTAIEPEVVRTLDEVRDEIRNQLAAQRAGEVILDIHDLVEDKRAEGSTLAEIAKDNELTSLEIPAVDRSGTDPAGKAVADMPEVAGLLPAIFDSDVGFEADPVQTRDDGFVWFNVEGITPERQKPLEEVRDEVIAKWKEDETRKALSKRAAEMVEQGRAGATIEALAKEIDAEVKTTEPFKRSGTPEGLPRTAVSQAFTLALDAFSSAATDDGEGRVIFQLTKIDTPKGDPPKEVAEALSTQLAGGIENDLLLQYIAGLRQTYPVSVNEAVFNRVTGRTNQ